MPALIDDYSKALYDSPVICAFLDTLSPSPQLVPEGSARWQILTAEALADGILDAAFAIVMEQRRPNEQQSPMWLDRWETAIERSLSAVEADLSAFAGELTLAQIALGAALGYLDFRLPDIDWRTDNPAITAWFGAFSERPSMLATDPEKV